MATEGRCYRLSGGAAGHTGAYKNKVEMHILAKSSLENGLHLYYDKINYAEEMEYTTPLIHPSTFQNRKMPVLPSSSSVTPTSPESCKNTGVYPFQSIKLHRVSFLLLSIIY